MKVAIIGAGLSGLMVAYELLDKSRNITIFEARERIGGRAFTLPETSVDIGGTWIWSENNSEIMKLIRSFGLQTIKDESVGPDGLRLLKGLSSLVNSLAESVKARGVAVSLGKVLKGVSRKQNGSVKLQFSGSDRDLEFDTVFIALPPRLAATNLIFDPPLPESLLQTMMNLPTWMAQQSKFIVLLDRAINNPLSDTTSAVVTRITGPCSNVIYDVSNGGVASLWGFGLPSEHWKKMDWETKKQLGAKQVLSASIINEDSQITSIVNGDWSTEEFTCTDLDRREKNSWDHPNYTKLAGSVFERGYWENTIFFAGSETASSNAGFLDGAIVSAIERVKIFNSTH